MRGCVRRPAPRPKSGSPLRHLLWPGLVVLLGYGLRIWRLDALSISGDEVNSILFATRPLAESFAALATNEPHPPFYYSFLRLWLPLAGQTEMAVRFPSVLVGTLGVAAAFAAGRTIGGRTAGLASATIFAVSQYSVLHAQDARMYAALQAWVALYLAGLVRLMQRVERRSWVTVVVAGSLAAYTHYHGLLVAILGVVPIALATPIHRWPARLSPWLAIALLFLPWAAFARTIATEYRGWMALVPPLDVVRRSVTAYSVGEGVAGTAGMAALWILPGLAVAGLATLMVSRRWGPLSLVLALGMLPTAVVVAGSLTGRPLFHERYLITVTPAFYLLAGLGLAELSRNPMGRLLSWGALGGLAIVALGAYYSPPMPYKPDFRAAVERIEREAGPGAAIVMPEPQGPLVAYYLKKPLPTYVNPPAAPDQTIGRELDRRLSATHEAWFVRYSAGTWDDPVGRWLESHAFYLRDAWITQIHLATYALPGSEPPAGRPISLRTTNGIQITEVRSGPDAVRPGDRVLAGFNWSALATTPATAKVSLRLLDPWGKPIEALDRPLANPTGLAAAGPGSVWQGALTIPEDAVPGRYQCEARFYDRLTAETWPVLDTTGRSWPALNLGEVTVEPSVALPSEAEPAAAAIAVADDLYLQDFRLSGGPFTPDSRLDVQFVWLALAARSGPIEPEIAVRSPTGDIVVEDRRAERDQPYPLRRLRAGERIRDRYELPLRPIAAAGRYSVELRLGAGQPWARLGTVDVDVDPARYRRPELVQPRADLFDGAVRLAGVTVGPVPVQAGAPLAVTLAWQAERLPQQQYTAFVQLLDAGTLRAQSDQIPAGGRRPTATWILGEYVVDEHLLKLADDLPPGTYRLVAGLYDPITGRRAELAGMNGASRAVDLGPVQVVR